MSNRDRTAAAAPQWVGWYKPHGGRWEVLVTANDSDKAWTALLDATDRRADGGGDLVVLAQGVRP